MTSASRRPDLYTSSHPVPEAIEAHAKGRRLAELEHAESRGKILARAADLLDEQASAHGESVSDYTDLLRVWAEDEQRWKAGS